MSVDQKRAEIALAMKRHEIAQAMANMPKKQDQFVDEMPSWLDSGDRSVVKNLSNNHEEGIKYLQGKYPDAEFKVHDGEIHGRKKGEADYRTLDPSFSPLSNPIGTLKDAWNDTKDMGYDALQGAAETAGAAMGSPGGLPGIMAASAGGAGAASYAKQKLRQHFGLADNVDTGEVLKDMAFGGAVPGVLHAGGQALKWGVQKAAPNTYGWLVGKNGKFIKSLAEKGDDVAKRSSDEALSSLEGLQHDFGTGIQQKLDDATKAYDKVTGGQGYVDVGPVVKNVDDYIGQLKGHLDQSPGSGLIKDQLEEALKFRNKNFGKGMTPKRLPLSQVQIQRNALNDAYLPAFKEDVGQMVGKGVSSTEEKLAHMVRDGLLDQADLATEGALGSANKQYSQLNRIADFGREYLGNPKKTTALLKVLEDGTDDVALGRFQRLPEEMQKQILAAKDERSMFNYLKGINKKRVLTDENVGSAVANGIGGVTPLEKILAGTGSLIGKTMGGYPGMIMGLAAGRVGGKKLVSPGVVLGAAKAGAKVGKAHERILESLANHPEIMNAIYGITNAGTK